MIIAKRIRESRRIALKRLALTASLSTGIGLTARDVDAAVDKKASVASRTKSSIERGLQWVARTQSKLGHWTASNDPTAAHLVVRNSTFFGETQ